MELPLLSQKKILNILLLSKFASMCNSLFSFCCLTFLFLDPSPWLILSFEMKKEDSLKPYGGILVGFPNVIIYLSFQMQRNQSGSLMEKVALTRP